MSPHEQAKPQSSGAEGTGKEAHIDRYKPEIIGKTSEIVGKTSEITEKEPAIAGMKPESAGNMTKIVEKTSEITDKKPEIAGKMTKIAGKPEIVRINLEIAGNKPEIDIINPEIAGNKPELVSIKPEISGNKPEIVSSKPEIVDKKAEDARKMREMVTLYPSPHTHGTSSKKASPMPTYIASNDYQAKQHSTRQNKSHTKIQSGWKDQLLKKCNGGGGTKLSWRPGSGRHVSDGPGSYRPFTHISRTLHLQDAINVCFRRRMEPKNIASFSCIDSRTLPHDHPCSNLQVLWFGTKTIGQDEDLPDWYGNVQFTVDANILLENWRYFYLVELLTTPTQTCSRILVTNTDYSAVLPPFDPRQPGGPWHTTPEGQKVLVNCSRYNFKGQNFHSHTLEFMVDVTPTDEFKLLQRCEISFRNHEEAQDLSVRHVCNRHQRLKTPCPTPFPRFATASHFFDALNLLNICILTGIPRLSRSARKYLDEYLKQKAIQIITIPVVPMFMPF